MLLGTSVCVFSQVPAVLGPASGCPGMVAGRAPLSREPVGHSCAELYRKHAVPSGQRCCCVSPAVGGISHEPFTLSNLELRGQPLSDLGWCTSQARKRGADLALRALPEITELTSGAARDNTGQ